MNIFKKKTSPKEALRTSKREMGVATRDSSLSVFIVSAFQEKKLVAEIKKTAKTGNEASLLFCLSCCLLALYASTSISTGMKGATKAMVAMNKIEMMSESIDETLDKDEAEEETEELTNQVLDEIGVDIASQLSSAPKGRIASRNTENVAPRSAANVAPRNAENVAPRNAANVVTSSESPDVEDLEKRLASLRRI
ncbi:hypothetical protein ACE6H2_013748 [Prunus campanulata]